jgi:hypothetical protein
MTDEEVHALAIEAGGPTGCGAGAEVACTGMTTAGHVCGKEPMVVMFSVREDERTDVLTFTVKLGVSRQAGDGTYERRVRDALRASLERLTVLDATIEDADVVPVCVQAEDDVTDALRASVKGKR